MVSVTYRGGEWSSRRHRLAIGPLASRKLLGLQGPLCAVFAPSAQARIAYDCRRAWVLRDCSEISSQAVLEWAECDRRDSLVQTTSRKSFIIADSCKVIASVKSLSRALRPSYL